MRKSLVESKTDEEFERLFYHSHNEKEFAYSLNIFNCGGGTFCSLKRRCERLGLDRKKQWTGAHKEPNNSYFLTDEEYFAFGTSRTGQSTRVRLLKEKLLPYRCAMCGNNGRWQGGTLHLEVDHINGNHFDNRLSNLRFLCPNCHALTETFSGKNARKTQKLAPLVRFTFLEESSQSSLQKRRVCQRCGKPISRWSKKGYCPTCSALAARKVERPDPTILLEEVFHHGCAWASRKYGVVESVIRKWLKQAALPYRKKEIRAFYQTK